MYNTSVTKGTQESHGQIFQKLCKDLTYLLVNAFTKENPSKWYQLHADRRLFPFMLLGFLRLGQTCCPFHDDKHPSMKVDCRFRCFGCQAGEDISWQGGSLPGRPLCADGIQGERLWESHHKELASFTVERGCGRLEWWCLDLYFYDKRFCGIDTAVWTGVF